MKRALVVGGNSAYVQQTIVPVMAERGLAVEWHWSMDQMPPPGARVPSGCQAVVALYEMIPEAGKVMEGLRATAKVAGIPLVRGARKKSILLRDLERCGFAPAGPNVAEAIRNAPAPHSSQPQQEVAPVDPQQPQKKSPTPRTFEQCVKDLRALLRELRDVHGVSEVIYGAEAGLELRRTQIVNLSLEEG